MAIDYNKFLKSPDLAKSYKIDYTKFLPAGFEVEQKLTPILNVKESQAQPTLRIVEGGGFAPLKVTEAPLQPQIKVTGAPPFPEPKPLDALKDKSTIQVFGESFRSGILKTGSAIETIASVGAKKIGAEQLSKKLETLSKQDAELAKVGINIQDDRKFKEKIKDPKWIAQGVGETLPTLLFGIGVAAPAAVIGAPALAVGATAFAGTATLEAGFAYQDAKEFGTDDKTAEKVAGIVGVANGILEALPITKLLTRSSVGKQIKRSIVREITKRVVTQAGLESGTESLQEIVSNSVAKVYDESRKLLAGVPESAFFGGLLGGGVSIGADITGVSIQKQKDFIQKIKPRFETGTIDYNKFITREIKQYEEPTIPPELQPLAQETRNYSWKTLKTEGKLFKGKNLTPEGRVAYLSGIIEANPLDIREIKYITGELPFPKKGMQGMTQIEWQKALNMVDNVLIVDNSKAYEAFGGGKISPTLFEGKFTDFYNQAVKGAKELPELPKAPTDLLRPMEFKGQAQIDLVRGDMADTNLFKQIEKKESGQALERPQALESKRWQVEMPKEPITEEKINKTEIMSWAEKTFGVPIKTKATHKWKAAGMYYPKKQIVRMEKWGELSVAAHEIAHHIDKLWSDNTPLGKRWKKPNKAIEKELADLDYDQEKRRTSEGFAEYIRLLETTTEAPNKAPNFTVHFNKLLRNEPKLENNLRVFKNKLNVWFGQGAENRIIQHIDWKGEHTKITGIQTKLKNALKWINEKWNDEFYVPQTIVREIEKVAGRKLRPTENPAVMMEYYKSKAGAVARTFVMDKAIDEYGNVKGNGLKEILKSISKKEMPRFIAYTVSKRALNLQKRNIESGFDVDDAKYIIEKYQNEEWDIVAKELTEWSNHLLDWVIRAGGLTPESAKLMRDLNPIYLPFKRAFIDEVGVVTGVGGYVDKGGVIKGIKGSGRPIINPIEAMITQAREIISKSQKIHIGRLFAELAEQEGIGGFITQVPAPMKATTFDAEQIRGYLEESGFGDGPFGDVGELDGFLTVFTQDYYFKGKENIVSIWKDGKRKFYEIHPDLYQSFKGIEPLKLNAISKILAPFSRMLRLGATGLKISFGVARNPFRDALSYAVFSKRKSATIFDPIKGIYDDLTAKPGTTVWRFRKTGGALSGMMGYDRAATMSVYDDMLLENLGKKGKLLKVAKHPVNTLRDILSITEMGPRSVEVQKNYDNYVKENPEWTEEDAFVQAFNDAQDVTINFTKSGKWAKQINEVAAFFNVAIRGPEKLYRSFRNQPIQTTIKGLVWLTLLAIGSWYKNKDKQWYKNLPPSYKYNNLFFEIGDTVYRLPVPFELGTIFMSVPQAALDSIQEDDLKYFKGVLDIAKSQIPDPTPSAFKPMIDVMANKDYLGNPIESEGMQYLYPTERQKDYTRDLSVDLSKGLDQIGIRTSPVQLDYLLDNYTGGFLKQFKLNSKEMTDLPIISDLTLKMPENPRRQLDEFFTDYEVLGQRIKSDIATKQEEKNYDKIKDFYTEYKDIMSKLKEAKEKKNNEKVEYYYEKLTRRLDRYGYR